MKTLSGQIIRFLIIGALAFAVDYGTYFVLAKILLIHYMIAGFCSFSLSLFFNYRLSMRYVFIAKASLKKNQAVFLFYGLSVLGLGLNLILLYGFVDLLKIQDLIAKLIVTGIVMVFNFMTRKIFLEQAPLKTS